MRKKQLIAYAAMASAIGLAAAACGSSTTTASGGSGGSGSGGGVSGFGAALTGIVNPSTATGGALVYDQQAQLDSADPGNTYEGANWDFLRLYDRTMLSYKPGSSTVTLEGDLATGLGQHNADSTVWTYTIQPNATFSNGTPITTADIKYAIERANWGTTLTQGPTYFHALIQDNTHYQGPYTDPTGGVSGISTPNATTIVFTLNQPFADFNYLMTLPQTAPVLQSTDTGSGGGTAYQQHMLTSGQYKISTYTVGKQMVLVPNTSFVAASDPNGLHKVYASSITVNFGVNQDTIDQNLLHGQAQLDTGGVGVNPAAQGQILANPTYKANSDSVPDGFQMYLSLNVTSSPFSNIDCRKSIEWAINKASVVTATGGTIGGGTVATNVLPPNNSGFVQSSAYSTPGNEGSLSEAKTEFAACKSALGSAFTPSFALATYTSDSYPKALKAADVIQQNLDAVGYNVAINTYPLQSFNSTSAPATSTSANAAHIGMTMTIWGADFPTGYGYMQDILTSAGISSSGGYNTTYWDSPVFDGDLRTALSASTPAASKAAYAAADAYALAQAVVVPLVNNSTLMYRPPTDTNVTVDPAYGMYDYTQIGTTNK
jgi:peptide/nickel transport system substrate-binding protein